MSTRIRNKVVPSPTTPNTATTVGQEVQGNPPATIVAAGGVPASGPPDPAVLVASAKRFRQGYLALLADFQHQVELAASVQSIRKNAVSKRQAAVIPELSGILRSQPDLAPRYSADAIDAGLAAVGAMKLVTGDLQSLLTKVGKASRAVLCSKWFEASAVLHTVRHEAKADDALAVRLAPVEAALANGKRTDTTVMATAAAAHQANKAQTRASKAQQRAGAASQSQTRTLQAHAANTRVRGTSPVPLANPQGPAASADVAPQGPAPGR